VTSEEAGKGIRISHYSGLFLISLPLLIITCIIANISVPGGQEEEMRKQKASLYGRL
jgi:hypothetical protein